MLSLTQASLALNSTRILSQLDLDFKTDSIYCLMGPSGSGKSTLLRVLADLQSLDDGYLTKPIDAHTELMFQQIDCFPWLTVQQNLKLGLVRNMQSKIDMTIDEVAKSVGLQKALKKYPYSLSGGMQKRVAMGRALLSQADVLLLDEPLGSLDPVLKMEMEQLLRSTAIQLQSTAVIATHEVGQAVALADYILIAEGPPLKIVKTIHIQKRNEDLKVFRQSDEYGIYCDQVRLVIQEIACD